METSRTNEDRQPEEPNGLDPTQSQTPVKDKNDINFGWFSLPASSEASARPGGKAQASKPDGALPANSNDMGQFSQGEPDMYTHPDCKTPESCRSTAQGGGDHNEVGASSTAAPGTSQETETCSNNIPPTVTVKYGEDFVVDWPLSAVGQEQFRRILEPELHSQSRSWSTRPWADESRPQVPPTPLPPLHWHGYRGGSRPTYKTWRDEWHKSSGRNPFQTHLDGNNNANVDGQQDRPELGCGEDLTTTGTQPELSNGAGSGTSCRLLHRSDKARGRVTCQADEKGVYTSIPQTTKKTTFLDNARSRIQSFPFLKWSCWTKGRGSHVKLLKYRKLSDEDYGEDNDFFNNY